MKIDQNIFLILKKFIKKEIGFNQLDKLWIDEYIEAENEFEYDILLSNISEYIYWGTSNTRTKDEISHGVLSAEEVRIKIVNDLQVIKELKTYLVNIDDHYKL